MTLGFVEDFCEGLALSEAFAFKTKKSLSSLYTLNTILLTNQLTYDYSLSVITDRLLEEETTPNSHIVDYFKADLVSSSDYYPFGMTMGGRGKVGTLNAYRYGYQGSEKDDEIKGSGNSYTTHFRQLDVRLGKWLSIDPKATAWESPYVSMGNNPIWKNDALGDVWDKSNDSQGKADGFRKNGGRLKKKLNRKKDDIINEMDGLEKTSKEYLDLNKKLININSRIDEIDIALKELDELEISDQVYRLEDKSRNQNETIIYDRNPESEGKTKYIDGVVVIQYWREGGGVKYNTMAHELKHAYQFEVGEISFDKYDGSPGSLYDMTDEQAAWKRGSAFDSNYEMPLDNLTYKDLEDRNYDLPKANLNINSTLLDIVRAHGVSVANESSPYLKNQFKSISPKMNKEVYHENK